jgi:aminodeoxyfutalosine deaminase
MKYISAERIHDGFGFLADPSVLVLDDENHVLEIIPSVNIEKDKTDFYEGIICPGFINTHCHLELSYLKNKISEGKGLDEFIREVEQHKNLSEEFIIEAIKKADEEMFESGIVAVGDISNNNSTFKIKANSKIKYHTFIEVYAFNPLRAETTFQNALSLSEEYCKWNIENKCSIVPHAPYSVSKELFKLIKQKAEINQDILTIHMQENEDEDLLFLRKEGKILERLKSFGIDTENFMATGKNSLESTLPNLPKENNLILVHNTFSGVEEINLAKENFKNLFFCFCLRANDYIEKKLPELELFVEKKCNITLGTDSYASNHSLKIIDEISFALRKTTLTLEQLICFATQNGARALGMQNKIGSFEKGKKPGVVQITKDKSRNQLTSKRLF